MCNWALFVLRSCCFCFSCWSFVPSCFPAGALLCASVEHLPHRLFPHVLPLPHHFPSLSCPFFSFALQRPSHLPLPNLFYCFFFFFFSPLLVVLHLPGQFPAPRSLYVFLMACQGQDTQWGWPVHVFAAGVWTQKGHLGYRSFCLLVTLCMSYCLKRWPLSEPRENGENLELWIFFIHV